jgi:hypothetical protein
MWSVLAVDQSASSTGWAHLSHGQKTPTWGRFTMAPWADCEGERLWTWLSWLGEKVEALQVTHLVLENTFIPPHPESLTQRIGQYGLIGMASVVAHLCNTKKNMNVDFSVVEPRTWRKAFIGKEEPPKGLVKHQRRAWLKEKSVAACHARGWLVENDDTADALGILAYACSAIDPAFMAKQGALFRKAEAQVEDEERSLR